MTAPLHDTIVQMVKQHVDEPVMSRITNIALALVGLITSERCTIGAMARARG